MPLSPKTLSKHKLIDLLAANLGSTKGDCGKFLDGLTEVVTAALKGGTDVLIPGLVKISLREKEAQPAKQKINPFTKQPITVEAKPAMKKVRAKALGPLKNAVA